LTQVFFFPEKQLNETLIRVSRHNILNDTSARKLVMKRFQYPEYKNENIIFDILIIILLTSIINFIKFY